MIEFLRVLEVIEVPSLTLRTKLKRSCTNMLYFKYLLLGISCTFWNNYSLLGACFVLFSFFTR